MPSNNAYNKEERKALKIAYLEYLQTGLNKEDFIPCDYRTVENFFNLQSEKQELEQAFRANRQWWTAKFKDACVGLLPNANITGLIFAMKNKAGWRDKTDIEHSGTVSIAQQIIDAHKSRAKDE